MLHPLHRTFIANISTGIFQWIFRKYLEEYFLEPDKEQACLYNDLYALMLKTCGERLVPQFPPGFNKFAFLEYLVSNKPVLLHGSTRNDLSLLKPMTGKNISSEKQGTLLFASSDVYTPLKRIFDKRLKDVQCHHPCFMKCYEIANNVNTRRYPFISINEELLDSKELFHGTIYVCPLRNFVRQSSIDDRWYKTITHGRVRKVFSSWTSCNEVRPLARIPLGIEDCPVNFVIHKGSDMELKTMLCFKRKQYFKQQGREDMPSLQKV